MLRLLVRIAVAAAVLYWLLGSVDVTEVGAALARASPLAIVLAALSSFAGNVVIAFRLRVLLAAQGVRARASQTLAINLAAFFYNLFLPVGGVGVAAIRLHRLSHHAQGRFTAALTAMVCDRLAATATLGLVGLAFWLVDPHPKPRGSFLALALGSTTALSLVAPRAVPHEVRRFVRDLTEGASGTWWAAVLHRFSYALGSVARISPAALARIFGISILAQLPAAFVFVLLGWGLDLPVSGIALAWIRSVTVMVAVLPISIGGLGVRETVLVYVMSTFGVPAPDAIALSLLVFATTILAPGLLGGAIEAVHWLRVPNATNRHA
jgi:uncharacterized membrane protein YbhN (UPF0104 family)